MTCDNPSADCSGYFITELKAKEAIAKKQKEVDESPDYYGVAIFDINRVIIDNILG